jgi:aconitate hydratase
VRPAVGKPREIQAIVRIDTPEELTAFRHGGILPYVLRQLVDRTN